MDPAPPPAGSCLLENGLVLTLEPADIGGRVSVAIEDGTITAVAERAALRRRFPHAPRIDCRGRIIMPGLVNAHLHPELHLLKGALEQRGLHDWADASFYNAAVDFLCTAPAPPLQRIAIRAALVEAALSGTTCVGTYGVTTGADTACADALAGIGLRGTVTIRDPAFMPAQRDLPVFYRLHAEEALHEPELDAAAAAHARGDRIVMHAAETGHRLDIIRARFGTTTIRLLDRYGLLSPRVLLSHAIQVDDEEIALIAERGAHVVVSPSAEMKLGDGTPRVVEMLAAGITVSLGTDAAVCNNSTDMFLEMRALGLSQKLRYGAAAIEPAGILRIATRNGAAALGGAGRFGVIAEGCAADLVMVDTGSPRLQPLITTGPHPNAMTNLVFSATGADVTDVMVRGRFIVRQRRLPAVDTRSLWRELGRAAQQLHTTVRL